MGRVADRLAAAGFEVPSVVPPLASYVPAVLADGWVYTAGQLPIRDGALLATGPVGELLDQGTAAQCAQQCALNAVAALSGVADLDRLRIVKVTGFVASAEGFTGQPLVLNGASDLLALAFGERGVHARSAVGVARLPLDAPVEVEVVARLVE